jgi:hypothetical protein
MHGEEHHFIVVINEQYFLAYGEYREMGGRDRCYACRLGK